MLWVFEWVFLTDLFKISLSNCDKYFFCKHWNTQSSFESIRVIKYDTFCGEKEVNRTLVWSQWAGLSDCTGPPKLHDRVINAVFVTNSNVIWLFMLAKRFNSCVQTAGDLRLIPDMRVVRWINTLSLDSVTQWVKNRKFLTC